MLICPFLPTFLWKLAFFFVFGSFLIAAASRALGYLEESPLKAVIRRFPNHLWNVIFFSLFLVLAATPAMLFVSLLSSEYPTLPDTARALILLVGTVPFLLIVFFRFWPALFVTFTCAAWETRRSAGGLWRGPGIKTVRALTKLEEAASTYTFPLFKHTFFIVGGFTTLYLALSGWKSALFPLTAVFYFLVLPLWTLVMVQLGGRLHQEWRREQTEEDTEPQLVTEAAFKPFPAKERRASGSKNASESEERERETHSKRKEKIPDETFTVIELTELERPASGGKGAFNPARTADRSDDFPPRPSSS